MKDLHVEDGLTHGHGPLSDTSGGDELLLKEIRQALNGQAHEIDRVEAEEAILLDAKLIKNKNKKTKRQQL